jgi:hypothetical protein
MDPSHVLGLPPDADDREIAQAYRELAKRYHPDRAGADGQTRMAQLNAAYDLLRTGLAEQQRRRHRLDRTQERTPQMPGHWLPEPVRRTLGPELVAALEPGEAIRLTIDTATHDSHDVRLAVTDRRLLWLRDDAINDRVRYERISRIAGMQERPPRGWRRRGELRIRLASGRRLGFGELLPADLDALAAAVRASTGA